MKYLAPVAFLALAVGLVSLLSVSGALGGSPRPVAPESSTPATVVLELPADPSAPPVEENRNGGLPEEESEAPDQSPGANEEPASSEGTETTTPVSEQGEVPPGVTPAGGSYTVQPGDTPYSIARALGVSLDSLLQANGIADPTTLQIGDVLQVPGE